METSSALLLRVDPALRAAAEHVLLEGETLSDFLLASIRGAVERRRMKAEFLASGLGSRDESVLSGTYFAAEDVHAALRQMLVEAKVRSRK